MSKKNRFAQFKNIQITSQLFVVLLLTFALFSTYFAMRLKPSIIPDEPYHLSLSQQFSTTWGIPPNTPATYAIKHSPFFYYWINGRVLNILNIIIPSPSTWKQIVVLRLLSVAYSIGTLIFCYLLSKEIVKNRWWQLMAVFMYSNTLMFVFLSGGVNYDNLTNLCCTASAYFLVRVFSNKPFFLNSLLWLIFICLGTLVKLTALPLAAIMFIIWFFYVWTNHIKIQLRPVLDEKMVVLVIVFIIFVVFNFSIYGKNLIKYKAITPSCSQILTTDQCNQNPIIRRDKQLNLPEKLTIIDVIKGGYSDPIEYVFDYWTGSMLKRIYGIMGHKSFFPDLIITFFRIFYLGIIFIIVKYWKKPTYAVGSLFLIATFYILVLLRTNYNAELTNGFQHIAIQGRYIFPVIGIIYTLVVYYLSQLQNQIIRRISYTITAILFLIGCPITFLTQYATIFIDWFYPL